MTTFCTRKENDWLRNMTGRQSFEEVSAVLTILPPRSCPNNAAMLLHQDQQMIDQIVHATRRRWVFVCTPGETLVKPLQIFALFPDYFVYRLWGTTNALHTPLLVPTEAAFVAPQCLRRCGGDSPPPFNEEYIHTVFELVIVISVHG